MAALQSGLMYFPHYRWYIHWHKGHFYMKTLFYQIFMLRYIAKCLQESSFYHLGIGCIKIELFRWNHTSLEWPTHWNLRKVTTNFFIKSFIFFPFCNFIEKISFYDSEDLQKCIQFSVNRTDWFATRFINIY